MSDRAPSLGSLLADRSDLERFDRPQGFDGSHGFRDDVIYAALLRLGRWQRGRRADVTAAGGFGIMLGISTERHASFLRPNKRRTFSENGEVQ